MKQAMKSHAALVPVLPHAPLVQETSQRTSAHLHPLLDPRHKQQILIAVVACEGHHKQNAEYREMLRERARLVPDFSVFRLLCIESMQQAYGLDQEEKGIKRRTKYRRLAWLAFFKHFAQHKNIIRDCQIKAINREGAYQCSLVEKKTSGTWEEFIALGSKKLGIPKAKLNALYADTYEAKQATAG